MGMINGGNKSGTKKDWKKNPASTSTDTVVIWSAIWRLRQEKQVSQAGISNYPLVYCGM